MLRYQHNETRCYQTIDLTRYNSDPTTIFLQDVETVRSWGIIYGWTVECVNDRRRTWMWSEHVRLACNPAAMGGNFLHTSTDRLRQVSLVVIAMSWLMKMHSVSARTNTHCATSHRSSQITSSSNTHLHTTYTNLHQRPQLFLANTVAAPGGQNAQKTFLTSKIWFDPQNLVWYQKTV